MRNVPELERSWDYENGFYLTCEHWRIAKFIAHYEIFKRSIDVPGTVVECGVCKGASLMRFLSFNQILTSEQPKKIFAFDIFGEFPETTFEADQKFVRGWKKAVGKSISEKQLCTFLKHKGAEEHVELIAGDITKTVPAFLEDHPDFQISFLNVDTDIYEPAVTILEHFYPRVAPGGIVLLDNYGVIAGETKAVNEYFEGAQLEFHALPIAPKLKFIVKP